MRVGVIGCGYVFDHYMATWARHPKLELAGVADLDADRAETVAGHTASGATGRTRSCSPIPPSASWRISPASKTTSR